MTEAFSPLKTGYLTKLDKDRRLFELAGHAFFYDLPDDPYLDHLDELGIEGYRREREHNFKLALEEVKKNNLWNNTQDSVLSVEPDDLIWEEKPDAFTPQGEALWATVQQDATETTWRQLLEGTHPSQTESQRSVEPGVRATEYD
ncbi:hypothetical protein CF326_g8155 [Tilletia indica]|nr:hypothetical protein CF326_g8155 [Tilletia indica]